MVLLLKSVVIPHESQGLHGCSDTLVRDVKHFILLTAISRMSAFSIFPFLRVLAWILISSTRSFSNSWRLLFILALRLRSISGFGIWNMDWLWNWKWWQFRDKTYLSIFFHLSLLPFLERKFRWRSNARHVCRQREQKGNWMKSLKIEK